MKQVTITLSKELQIDFDSYLDVCFSLHITPSINSFLNYIHNFDTYTPCSNS